MHGPSFFPIYCRMFKASHSSLTEGASTLEKKGWRTSTNGGKERLAQLFTSCGQHDAPLLHKLCL